MRIAILSDVHGNLEALTAVLDLISNASCDRIVCLGDVVGYGPNPRECIALIKANAELCVLGNHDQACATTEFPFQFTSVAQQSVLWTRERLSQEDKTWLIDRPLSAEMDGASLVHACFDAPATWEYLIDRRAVEPSFKSLPNVLGFVGHTHQARAWIQTTDLIKGDDCDRVHIDPGNRYIVNVGSVGQPRDRDPRACFALWDIEKKYIDLKRVPYDCAKTAAKIFAAGLPVSLGERLLSGR